MRKHTLNAIIALAVVALLVLLASHVRIPAAADAVVFINVSGVRCASCTREVSALLQRERGVAAAETQGGGVVAVGYDSGTATPARLLGALAAAGFTGSITRITTPQGFKKLVGHALRPEGGHSTCSGKSEESPLSCGGSCEKK